MKSKERRYFPSFVTDLKQAIEYYDGISSVTGNKLRDEIQSKMELIASTSEGFAIVHNNVRALRLKKFPYVMLYRSHTDYVEFIGLVSGSKERKHWFDTIE
jgi:hypothetical protein